MTKQEYYKGMHGQGLIKSQLQNERRRMLSQAIKKFNAICVAQLFSL